ncbi:MAG: ABC transporter substrate-binding protein [Alphaproteobacteria bacterium]|nr:ABC transporter substrate-binding protein [Alphaproteobacteria bacterium]
MKLLNKLTLASTILAASLSAHTAFAVDGFPVTVTDAAGIEHTFNQPPKIGCDWYGCIEIMADFDLQIQASEDSGAQNVFYTPAGLPKYIIEDYTNPEHWANAEVEVIMTRVPVSDEMQALTIAAPVFYLHHPSYGESDQSGFQAYIKNIELIGQLTGEVEKAAAAKARFNAVISNLKARATDETRNQKIAILFGRDDTFRGIGKGNPFCALIAEIGLGECVIEGSKNAEVNAEEFLKLDPDWIAYSGGEKSYKDRKDPVWGRLNAVKNNQVFDTAGNRYYCCSTRGLIHALQDFSHYTLDNDIRLPGKLEDFDPTKSPLVAVVK